MIFMIRENKRIFGLANISFILLLITFALSIVSAADNFKPYLHKASVGDVPKLQTFGEYQTQLFQGSGSYSYTIDVPPGTNGLQPSVALLYNSRNVLQRPGILDNKYWESYHLKLKLIVKIIPS